MSEFIAWMVAGAGVTILLYAYWIELRTDRERRLAKCADEFYKSVGPLLKDPNAPSKAIDLLDFLNSQITNRSLARQIFFALLWRRFRAHSEGNVPPLVVSDYYADQRKDLLELFMAACVAGIFAISYQNQIFGLLLRRLVFFDLNGHRERAPEVLVSLKASGIGSNNKHYPAAA